MEYWQLKQRQALPLDAKIEMSKRRIREWYDGMDGLIYVSFSGGKDSTVLLHLVRSIYPDTPAVFLNTGLEFPEIVRFVRKMENVTWLKTGRHRVAATILRSSLRHHIDPIRKIVGVAQRQEDPPAVGFPPAVGRCRKPPINADQCRKQGPKSCLQTSHAVGQTATEDLTGSRSARLMVAGRGCGGALMFVCPDCPACHGWDESTQLSLLWDRLYHQTTVGGTKHSTA